MSHWVVRKVRVGSDDFEAWGKVTVGPGCDEIYYFRTDGYTAADIDHAPPLGEVLFVVPIDPPAPGPEVASRRDTFPSSPAPPDLATMGTTTGDED